MFTLYGFSLVCRQFRCFGVRRTLPPVLIIVQVGTDELLFMALAILSFFARCLFLAIDFTCSSSKRDFTFAFLALNLLEQRLELLV